MERENHMWDETGQGLVVIQPMSKNYEKGRDKGKRNWTMCKLRNGDMECKWNFLRRSSESFMKSVKR